LGVPAEVIKNFSEEAVFNIIGNTIDKLIEAFEENKKLYERLVEAKKEKVAFLEKLLSEKK